MKPGKPVTFAEIIVKSTDTTSKKILAFGLPGNPVSCLVCFHLFVVPAIHCLAGWANPSHLRYVCVFLTNACMSDFFFFFFSNN